MPSEKQDLRVVHTHKLIKNVLIVYAIWSGVGIVLTAIVAFFAFGQKPDLAGLIGMAMIIGGVLVINLFSQSSAH
ncbi:SMR family transporter [Neisseria yangbaofengii]|uniref:SMR family transporter n=1 Tax=Neisseria yangbaofengii TaxID=2709396 RepID=UPI001F14A436|nr:SMR family transporter [Neisseria yangbaofengii]